MFHTTSLIFAGLVGSALWLLVASGFNGGASGVGLLGMLLLLGDRS